VEAATVDHGLRPESAAEAQMVADVCAAMGVPHAMVRVQLANGNMQSEARAARYAALARWLGERDLAALATAHHADDQAETLLMRLNRGSGVAGLAGVRERGRVPQTALPLLRPLLGWRRSELTGIVEAAGLEAVQDASNSDDRFDRIRIRMALKGADWLDVQAIAASASHLSDADAALEWAAEREWREAVAWDEESTALYRVSAPRAITLRVMARIIEEMGGGNPRGGQLARLYEALLAGTPATIAHVMVRPENGGWRFSLAPARHGSERP
jgi:tRNA(Ile)-lysidine synthase